MSKLLAIVVGIILLVVLILFSTTYTVSFHEVAIRTRFGKTDEASLVTEPGLKFRLPIFADKVTTYDTRLRLIETPLETIKTADDQQIVVRAFLMWRIDSEGDGPLRYHDRYRTEVEAQDALSDQFRSALLQLGQYALTDLLGEGGSLAEAEDSIRGHLALEMKPTGVVPVTVGVSRLMLPREVSTTVTERMEATRKSIAESTRREGKARADQITSKAANEAEKILSFAQARAEEIQAAGSNQAAKYLAQMGDADEDFAILLTWLDALETALSEQSTLYLSTKFAPFHLLDMDRKSGGGAIPMPEQEMLPPLSPDAITQNEDNASPAEGGS